MTGVSLEETVTRMETRLKEFEDRTAKKIKDLETLVQYLTNKVILATTSTLPSNFILVDKPSWKFKGGK